MATPVGDMTIRYLALKPCEHPDKPWLQEFYIDGSYPDDHASQGVKRIMRLFPKEAMMLLGLDEHPHAGLMLGRFYNKGFTIVAEGHDGFKAVYLHDFKFYLIHIPFECAFGRMFYNKDTFHKRIVQMPNDLHF